MDYDRTACFRLAASTNFQSFGDGEEGILLSLNSGYLYSCNAVAAMFLEGIEAQNSLATIAGRLVEHFEVNHDLACRDLARLAEELLDERLIERIA
jgi:coenzyme PQQ synthesis protein D (PqqD)